MITKWAAGSCLGSSLQVGLGPGSVRGLNGVQWARMVLGLWRLHET